MNFRKNIYTVSISAAMLVIAGCGITPQDEGLGDSSSKAMSGVVVDGYLAGATVFVDVNENNTLDAWENRALTDTKGYYSYNPIDGVNYCELPETDSKSIHCLKAPAGYDEVMVRMTGGYDLATVEPFNGTISMKMNLTSVVIETPVAATPITGLMSEMTAEEQAQFFVDEGLTTTIAASDFLDYDNSLTADERKILLGLALKAHKTADVVAVLLDEEFDQGTLSGSTAEGGFFGVADGVPVDGSLYVYRAMVEEWRQSSGTSLSTILSSASTLESVINRARTAIEDGPIAAYNARLSIDPETGEIDVNEVQLVAPGAGAVASAAHAALVVKIANTVDTVFGSGVTLDESVTGQTDGTNTLPLDITSRMRAIDAVVSLTRNGEAGSAVDNAVSLVSDGAYLDNLRLASVDMASLKKKFIANPGTVVAADADFSGRKAFGELFGSQTDSAFTPTATGASVNTEGFAGNTLALNNTPSGQSAADEVSVNFMGAAPDATGGKLTIDATLIGGDFAKTDPDTGVPAPLELTGTWEQVDPYTMMMNIEVTTGVFQPVIVKPNETGGYYFDLGGEQVSWGGGAAQ